MAAVVGDDRPEVTLLRLTTPGIEHRRRGFIHEQVIRRCQMAAHAVGNGLQMEAGATGPVAQCRPIKSNPLARIDLGLTVKRRMVAKLGDHHLRNRRFGR